MTKKDYTRIIEDLATAQNAVDVPRLEGADSPQQKIVNATIAEVARQFAYSEVRINPKFSVQKFNEALTKLTGIQPRF